MKGPRDDFTSPLDEVLEDIPQEKPPPDLKDRCLQALREAADAAPARGGATWGTVLKGAIALAAAFVLAVGVLTVISQRNGRPTADRVARITDGTVSRPGPTDAVQVLPEPADAGPGSAPSSPPESPDEEALRTRVLDGVAGDQTRASTEPMRLSAEEAKTAVRQRAYAGAERSPGLALASEGPLDERFARAPTAPAEHLGAATWGEAEARPETASGAAEDRWISSGGAVTKPWRDLSSEREKITHKQMELEVEDVEDAHKRATSIIERAEGYVDTEELRIDQDGDDRAHLFARVPVENLDGVVAQLRDLGTVLTVVGETDDRTREYRERGASIRELGAKECELVEKYEKERNLYRKRELYRQIMAIRAQNKQEKAPLLELSDKTHLAFLDLTLTEAGGPGRFLSDVFDNAGTAGLWLAVSAIFWIPALLVGMAIWRLVRRR